MHIQQTCLILLSLLSLTASAYVVSTWKEEECFGYSECINVWDNTCHIPHNPFRSVRVIAYGGNLQAAMFYRKKTCDQGDPTGRGNYWADGGDREFLVGECVTFKHDILALGSYYALDW